MLKKLMVVAALSFSSLTSYAGDRVIDPNNKAEVKHRIRELELKLQYSEGTLKARKELAEDALKTSGYAKMAWIGAAAPSSIVAAAIGGGFALGSSAALIDCVSNGISFELITSESFVGLSTYGAAGAAAAGTVGYANYALGDSAYNDIKGSEVKDIKLIQLNEQLAKHSKTDLNNVTMTASEQLERLNEVREELDRMQDDVFNNELDGSTWNTIKDHILAGTVAADGTLKLLQITAGKMAIDQSELKFLNNLLKK